MFSYHEWQGQASYHKAGEIQVNQHYYTQTKPAWLVCLKLLGLAAMVAVGYAIAIPSLREVLPLWQTIVLVAGVMLVYTGIAFFVRPEADGDNMGIAGGFANDPFQYSDNINRCLWNLHCLLGPGRFAAETLLDVCVYAGLAGGEEVLTAAAEQEKGFDETGEWSRPADVTATPQLGETNASPILTMQPLSPDRFARK